MNRTRLAAGLAALSIVALAGCGSAATSQVGSAPPSAVQTYNAGPTPAQVARQIGATGLTPRTVSMYASAEETGTWHGKTVDITTFQTTALRDQWIAIGQQYGPILATGPLWTVTNG
jgi:hypothetical protein